MTKKQKNVLYRILFSAVIFALFFLLFHAGLLDADAIFENHNYAVLFEFCLYLIPYVVIGGDVVKKAVVNIGHGQVFDENFLMCIATFAAFGTGEYDEAVAVMLFYQVGELFQSYAVNRSRRSITELMDICPEYANLETESGVEQTDPEDVLPESIIVIKPGEKVPLDGVVVEGSSFVDTSALTGVVLVYKCGQKKLNNLYYQMKEQRRCSTWRKIKNLTLRNLNSRSWICIMPEELRIHNWNVNMA